MNHLSQFLPVKLFGGMSTCPSVHASLTYVVCSSSLHYYHLESLFSYHIVTSTKLLPSIRTEGDTGILWVS